MADINIYGKLVNATPEGVLADSEQIKDTVQNKKQSEINVEVKDKLEELESRPEGVSEYSELTGKPQIGGIELIGNKSLSDLGIQAAGDYATKTELDGKVDDSEISDMLTKTEADSVYAKKVDLPEDYTLPIASSDTLGGVKIGAGLSINSETGVLSTTGGGVADSVDWSNITSKPETFKPEEHQHVSSDITDLQDKLDSKQDVGNYITQETANETFATKTELDGKVDDSEISDMLTKTEASNTYALKSEIPDISNLATKTELDGKVDDSEISDMLTKTEASNTYATKSELSNKVDISSIEDMETKTNAAATYQPIGDYLTSIPEEYITDEELNSKNYSTKEELNNKQDTLVSGTNIKTINGNSILGSGDLEINVESGISDAPEDGGVYGRSNGQWVTILGESGSTIVVDSELSDSSLNPVQNKIITSELNSIKSTSIRIKGEKNSLDELLLLTDSKVGDLWVINSNFTLGGINYISGSSVICKKDTTTEEHTEDNYKSLSAVDLTGYVKETDIEGIAICTPISNVTEILQ